VGDRSDDGDAHRRGYPRERSVRARSPWREHMLAGMRAIQMQEFGGPEVLQLVELPIPEPADGEVLIKVGRAGLNYADTHQRTNSYLAKATLPLIPGSEVAGVREDTGERVVALRSEERRVGKEGGCRW